MVKFLLLAFCVAITVWFSRRTTMNKTIHDFIRRFTHSREWCHEEMQKRGSVGPDGCPGLVGGDHETDFLQYECIGCPYIDPKAYCTHPANSK